MSSTDRLERVGNLDQLGGTQLVTLDEGAQRGVRVVEFRNAAGLELGLLVDRALDVAWCRHNGRSLAWHSPTGWVGPWFREPDGLGFLRTFGGGLLVTCGLDHILFPEEDAEVTYNYPGRTATSYGLHGRVSATPASLQHHGLDFDGEPKLVARATVRQAGALAENLVLDREVTVPLDDNRIEITDTVRNEGWYPTPHMLLYHMNFGAPLLSEHTEFVAPVEEVVFRTPSAEGEDPDVYRWSAPPTEGFVEQAFAHRLKPSADGTVSVSLVNNDDPARPWGVRLDYSAEEFPYFFQWRYLDRGAYVVGLEPSTNGLEGRAAARESGELRMLEPGQTRTYHVSLTVLEGDAVAESGGG